MPRRVRSLALAVVLVGASCAGNADEPPDAVTDPPPATDQTTGVGPPSTFPGSAPAATDPAPPATDDPDAVRPEGFTTVTVRLTAPDGEVCEVCMWLADDGDERGRGLMGVTDLGDPAGMVFVFSQEAAGAFYMFGTPTPLSIAWFAADGRFVSATDMEPCLTAAADCERYFSSDRYQLAIEVFEGGLGDLGIGPGSTAEVVAGTEAAECHTVASS